MESAPGEGSTFHFSISAREAAGLAPTERQRRSLDPTLAARLPLRILLAEDVTVNQKVATMLLAKMGYRADIACNGEEAVEAVQRQPYDVILMDVHMPVMDGIEATRRIRAAGGARRPRIVAITAGALQHNRDACLAAGMNDFLPKPIEAWKLQAALERSAPLAAPPADTPGQPPATLDWAALTDV